MDRKSFLMQYRYTLFILQEVNNDTGHASTASVFEDSYAYSSSIFIAEGKDVCGSKTVTKN